MNSSSEGANDATQMPTPNAIPVLTSTLPWVSKRLAANSAPKIAPAPMAIDIQL